jgi:hypothetical protein
VSIADFGYHVAGIAPTTTPCDVFEYGPNVYGSVHIVAAGSIQILSVNIILADFVYHPPGASNVPFKIKHGIEYFSSHADIYFETKRKAP